MSFPRLAADARDEIAVFRFPTEAVAAAYDPWQRRTRRTIREERHEAEIALDMVQAKLTQLTETFDELSPMPFPLQRPETGPPPPPAAA